MRTVSKILIASLICLISKHALAEWIDTDVQALLDKNSANADAKPIEQLSIIGLDVETYPGFDRRP
jgi:hypothetical protein